MECCRKRGINRFDYLGDVLERFPGMKIKEVEKLTPEAWAKAWHAKAVKASPAREA